VTGPSDARSLRGTLKRWVRSETAVVTLTAVMVGALTGGAVIVFVGLIRFIEAQFLGAWAPVRPWAPLIPAGGGLAAGLLIYYIAPEMRGGSIPSVLSAIALQGSRLRARLIWAKPLATAICIGTGGSAGRVGPIVQIGAALGSQVGQRFHMTDERIRNLVACGAAAGIASTFNAPIAGVIFALEVILGEFTESYFATIVISAVTSSIITQAALGADAAFTVPAYILAQPLEILFYVPLGGLAALVALLFTTTHYGTVDLTAKLRRVPLPLRPALGGLLLGLLALGLPQVLGGGFRYIDMALHGLLSLPLMALLVFGKLLATNLTVSTGSSGGIFAPMLFMGAMLGGAYGEALEVLLPGMSLAPSGAYALVGMAAVFSAAAHAPMTSLLIVFEMSGSYSLILPLMLATGLSTVMALALQSESIYTLALVRRGIHVWRGEEMDVLQHVTVEEVMAVESTTVEDRMRLDELEQLIRQTRDRSFPVLDNEGRLIGFITLEALAEAKLRWEEWEQHTVDEIYSRELITAYPDESVSVALQRMGVYDLSQLPVVDRESLERFVGLIRQSDIGAAYQQALRYRSQGLKSERRRRLEVQAPDQVIDVVVPARSPIVGRSIRSVAWPEGCLIVAVHRDGDVILGQGGVVIRPDDRLTVYARAESAAALRALVAGEEA
jgi:chloride channel protein, CIC family